MLGEYTGEINNQIADIPEDNPTNNPRLDRRRYKIPNDMAKAHPSPKGYIGSDEFDLPVDALNKMVKPPYHARTGLSLYWQWNHNPIDEAWSLSERPGFMRPKTPPMCAPMCTGSVCLDVAQMKDGDICGLAAYNGDSGVLRIVKKGGKWVLQLTEEKSVFGRNKTVDKVNVEVIEEVPLKLKTVKTQDGKKSMFIYLKVHGDFNPRRDMAQFSWSQDGENWQNIGREIKMVFDYQRHFMGSKFAIFNYATKAVGGIVDVDWFHVDEK